MQQCCYVRTIENPADFASRGLNVARVQSGSCWFEGPPFLWQNENSWLAVKGVEMEVLTDDPELRREAKSYAAIVHEDIIEGSEERISSWLRLKRIIGLVLCFKRKILDCIRGTMYAKELNQIKQYCNAQLDLEGIKMSEKEIVRSVQRRCFGEELISLGKR